ncbi:MAG TPA: hypothetical protein VF942_10035 [Acidimicrobiales bacterium]
MADTTEPQGDALMRVAVTVNAVGDARVGQQPYAVRLEDAGPIVCSIYRRLRLSMTTEPIPLIASRCDSIRPAGPPPTMPTVVGVW